MQKEVNVNPEDKSKVLGWMMSHCFGFRNARKRAEILPFVQLPDRYFRLIVSELKHEGHLASDCQRGYWFIPLNTRDREEIEAALGSYQEMKSKALDLLTGCDKHIKFWEDKKNCLSKQYELNLV